MRIFPVKSFHAFPLLVIMCLSSLAVWNYERVIIPEKSIDFSVYPYEIEEWKGVEAFLDNRVPEILETPYILHRIYRHKGRRVLFSIIYYPNSRTPFHSPEACLGGEGYSVVKKQKLKLKLYNTDYDFLQVVFLLYRRNTTEQIVAYYYETKGMRTDSIYKFKVQMFKNALGFQGSGGALVRVAVPVEDGDSGKAMKTLVEFLGVFANYTTLFLGYGN